MGNQINNLLKKTSIRGRTAFSLSCFFVLLEKFNLDINSKWIKIYVNYIKNFLLQYDIEKVEYYLNEIAPYSILDNHPNNDFNQYETISFNDATELKSLYENLPNEVIQVMNYIMEVAFGNLYGDTGEYSKITFEATLSIIDILKANNIEIPNLEKFSLSKFEEDDGWGEIRSNRFWEYLLNNNNFNLKDN